MHAPEPLQSADGVFGAEPSVGIPTEERMVEDFLHAFWPVLRARLEAPGNQVHGLRPHLRGDLAGVVGEDALEQFVGDDALPADELGPLLGFLDDVVVVVDVEQRLANAKPVDDESKACAAQTITRV